MYSMEMAISYWEKNIKDYPLFAKLGPLDTITENAWSDHRPAGSETEGLPKTATQDTETNKDTEPPEMNRDFLIKRR